MNVTREDIMREQLRLLAKKIRVLLENHYTPAQVAHIFGLTEAQVIWLAANG